MAEISIEDFCKLTPREIRKWYGIGPVARIIRYLKDGQYNHRLDALRTINHWLRRYVWKKEELENFCWVIPYILEQFSKEQKAIRLKMGITLNAFLEQRVLFDEELIEKIDLLLCKEEDEEVKKRLYWIKGKNKLFKLFSFGKYYHFTLKDKINRSEIEDTEFYQVSLAFKARREKKVAMNAIMCVYFVQEKDNKYVKIGKTKNLKTKTFFPYKMPFEWELIHTIQSKNIDSLEKFFHNCFKRKQINGEWFNLSEEDWEYIKNFDEKKAISV